MRKMKDLLQEVLRFRFEEWIESWPYGIKLIVVLSIFCFFGMVAGWTLAGGWDAVEPVDSETVELTEQQKMQIILETQQSLDEMKDLKLRMEALEGEMRGVAEQLKIMNGIFQVPGPVPEPQGSETEKEEGFQVIPLYVTRGGEIVTDNIIANIPINELNIHSLDLRTRSIVTAAELEVAFRGTGLEGLGQAFKIAEARFGVNAVFLASVAALESGWGRSWLAENKNNLFGWAAYDDNLRAAKTFEDKAAGVMFVAERIVRNYLTEGGRYHNGFTLKAVGQRYATDSEWAQKIGAVMRTINNRVMMKRVAA